MIQKILDWCKIAGIEQTGDKKQFELIRALIAEEYAELEAAFMNKDKNEQTDAVGDLIWVVLNWAHMNNLPIIDYLKKIEISNYSKFCTTEKEAQLTVNAYMNGIHPDKKGIKIECFYEKVGEYFVIKRIDNKILKNINYKPVNKLNENNI